MIDLLSSIATLPAEYVKTAGTLLGGAFLAFGTYVISRIKEARRPVGPSRRCRACPASPSTPSTATSASPWYGPRPT